MGSYRVTNVFIDGLITVNSSFGSQPWALTTSKCWKPHQCMICGREIEAGTERMYRPIGNTMNRMHRICTDCVDPEDCIPEGDYYDDDGKGFSI